MAHIGHLLPPGTPDNTSWYSLLRLGSFLWAQWQQHLPQLLSTRQWLMSSDNKLESSLRTRRGSQVGLSQDCTAANQFPTFDWWFDRKTFPPKIVNFSPQNLRRCAIWHPPITPPARSNAHLPQHPLVMLTIDWGRPTLLILHPPHRQHSSINQCHQSHHLEIPLKLADHLLLQIPWRPDLVCLWVWRGVQDKPHLIWEADLPSIWLRQQPMSVKFVDLAISPLLIGRSI